MSTKTITGILSTVLLLGLLPAGVRGQAETDECRVYCANLVYGADGQTAKCFSSKFLVQLEDQTHIATHPEFVPVNLEALELFLFPFAIMSGEKSFDLTEDQRANLRHYLMNGGFLVASAGCSSSNWQRSFTREFKRTFPEYELVKLGPEHPIFHTVNDVSKSRYKSGEARFPDLYGLEIDGTIRMIYSPDGLNDTGSVGDKNCCCCGGNEIKDAIWINMNLLAFALTH